MKKPSAILFDFGDTLVTSDPPYIERIRLSLGKLGHKRSEEEMLNAYLTADIETSQLGLGWADGMDKQKFDIIFFKRMIELLNIDVEMLSFAKDLGKAMTDFNPTRPTRVEVPETLKAIAALNIPMAVLSNNDGYTERKCEEAGITQYFDQIIDSTVEGFAKPDPRLFQRALDMMNVKAEETLHVGDLFGCDVLGANAAGIPVVWYNFHGFTPPAFDSQKYPAEHKEIKSLLEILDMFD